MALFEVHHIHKRFGHQVVLEDITLSFEEGTVSGIIGPNGAGKTTCFDVLTGRYKPDRGDIRFRSQSICGLAPQQIARLGISRSFQTMNLFDQSSVIENIIVALPEFRSRRLQMLGSVFEDAALMESARNILEQVDLAGNEWETSSSLSYGDRRALEIGVALASQPSILFLDEPTSGLGTEATRGLASLINKLRATYTIVMIEHDMQFLIELADWISVIHWGQVIAEGTPNSLRSNKWVQRSSIGKIPNA